MATYLGLVNKVMTELRKPIITEIDSDYARLVGQKVNQAKEEVEASHPWSALRTDITFSTVAGTQDYNLGTSGVGTGGTTNERSYLVKDMFGRPAFFNKTASVLGRVHMQPRELMRADIAWNLASNAIPSLYSIKRAASGVTISLYPKPDAVYSMQATFVIPQPELTDKADILIVPEKPVYLLAAAYAALERGGGQGTEGETLKAMADRALNDAINFDSEPVEQTMFEC